MRVVFDLQRFGVAGVAVFNVIVGRVVQIAAGIANGCADHARNGAEQIFHAPETAAGKSRQRRFAGCGCVVLVGVLVKKRQILLEAFFGQLLNRNKAQRSRIHAIAPTSWHRAIVKDVT